VTAAEESGTSWGPWDLGGSGIDRARWGGNALAVKYSPRWDLVGESAYPYQVSTLRRVAADR